MAAGGGMVYWKNWIRLRDAKKHTIKAFWWFNGDLISQWIPKFYLCDESNPINPQCGKISANFYTSPPHPPHPQFYPQKWWKFIYTSWLTKKLHLNRPARCAGQPEHRKPDDCPNLIWTTSGSDQLQVTDSGTAAFHLVTCVSTRPSNKQLIRSVLYPLHWQFSSLRNRLLTVYFTSCNILGNNWHWYMLRMLTRYNIFLISSHNHIHLSQCVKCN